MEYNESEQKPTSSMGQQAGQSDGLDKVPVVGSVAPIVMTRLGLRKATLAPEADSLELLRDQLVSALSSSEWAIRAEAVRRLGKLREPIPSEPLVKALHDENGFVRAAAAQAVGTLKERMPVEDLVAALSDPEWRVRNAAVLTLGRLGERAPAEQLEDLLTDEDASVRASVAWALGETRGQASIRPLVVALHDADWSVREAAALALGQLGEQVPVEPLSAALEDEDGSVREAARLALQQTHPEVLSTTASSPVILPQEQGTNIVPNRSENASFSNLYQQVYTRLTGLGELARSLFGITGAARQAQVEMPYLERTEFDEREQTRQSARNRRQSSTARPRLLLRIVEGGVIVLVILGITLSWLELARILHPPLPRHPRPTPFPTHTPIPTASPSQHTRTLASVNDQELGPPTWLLDGKHVVFLNGEGNWIVVDTSTGESVTYSWPIGDGSSTSPYGRYIITYGNGTIDLFDSLTGRKIFTSQYSGTGPSWDWSIDERHLAFPGANNRTLQVWDAVKGGVILSCSTPSTSIENIVASPDGQRIAISFTGGIVSIWNVTAGCKFSTIQDALVSRLTWAPDDRRIALSNSDGTVQIWDTLNQQRLFVYPLLAKDMYAIEWSPDGTRIIAINSTTVEVLDASTGKTILKLSPIPTTSGISWALSPDGRHIAFSSSNNMIQIWNTISGQLIEILDIGSATVETVAWSADSRYIAVGNKDGSGQIWDTATKHMISQFGGNSASIWDIAWSPNDRFIATAETDGTGQVWQVS